MIANIPMVCMKGAGAMARNKYPEETVARILDVSLKLFLEKGYENTTIQDIIDALGNLSKGAIYHHFKSKEDILEAVCDQRLFAGVEALMNEVVTDKRLNGREKLTRMFTASLQNTEQGKFFSAAPDMTHTPRLMMLQLDSQIREVGPNYLEPVLREGNADGSLHVEHVREASDLLLLITNQYLNPLLYPMTPEEARERCSFVRQLLAGVGLDVFDGEMLENFFVFSAHAAKKQRESAGGCRRRRCKCEKAGGRLLGLAAQEGPRRAGTVVRSCSWNHLHANTARMSVYARRIRPSKITCPKGQFIFRDIHTNRRY